MKQIRRTWHTTVLFAALGLLALAVGGCGVPGTIASNGQRLPHVSAATPTPPALPPVHFPQDEAPHHDLTEWWYYTGHVHGQDAQEHDHIFGFELTFFQTLRGGFPPYYAAHFAISDITDGHFSYDQREGFVAASAIPATGSTNGFDLRLDDWSIQGLTGYDHLNATMQSYAIDFSLVGIKPAVLHNGNGIITYGTAGFSYYYSRPLMRVSGTLTDHGAPIAVTGQAWMDHQWGNFVSLTGSGWDWYSIQLSNNTEYMLYVIRDSEKRPISVFGTAVAPDGSATEIPAAGIQTQALSTWTSPVTHGVYPSGWNVTIPSQGLSLTLTPQLHDQELVTTQSTGVAYWEGAVSIQGRQRNQAVSGEGYVELTGYASIPSSSQSAAVP